MATPSSSSRTATTLLQQYAEYHRDRRNILTHFVGVPMIVFGVAVLLARPSVALAGFNVTLAGLVFALAALWYLTRGALALGAAVSASMGLLVWLAHGVSGGSVGHWLAWGLGFLGVGWVIQFIGHYYEGKKPAFADDLVGLLVGRLVGLLVGPMFVMMEGLAPLGLFKRLLRDVEAHAGATVLRDLAHPAVR